MKLFRTIEIAVNDDYKVGDVIAFVLNDGEEVEALAVKQEQDGMIFCLVDCLSDKYHMEPAHFESSGYEHSELRKKLNTKILDRFPAEIREKMVAFPNGDMLRLPTEREIFGGNIYGVEEDDSVEQWEPMKDCRNLIAYQGSKTGTREWYWLQNRAEGSSFHFANVTNSGYAASDNASDYICVRPVFKI